MRSTNVFQGRTVAVASDLSLDERKYLFEQARELKAAKKSHDRAKVNSFRIRVNPSCSNDDESGKYDDYGIYSVFFEPSTRTKESFSNAASFHRVKYKDLDPERSSFVKLEDLADAFKMLVGYENHQFIVRSKIEGVCRWLESALRKYVQKGIEHGDFAEDTLLPSLINGGDGKHEHPTQELLDDFTFWEHNAHSYSPLHLALTGDLFHGRTIHSKVDGLLLFPGSKVDLIAPSVLGMPESYMDLLKYHGFEVRTFNSIDEYVSQGEIATMWYFSRLQLERMTPELKDKISDLEAMVTFRPDHMQKVPEKTKLYHPLPRDKTMRLIPKFLDDTDLNGWDMQSRNGYWIRIVLLAALAGRIGNDFTGEPYRAPVFTDDFIEQIQPRDKAKNYDEGIKPIAKGYNIDHICRGESPEQIWTHLARVMDVMGLHGTGYIGVSESKKQPGVYKGFISVPNGEMDEKKMKKLAAVAPNSTLNIIDNKRVVGKYAMHAPPRIYGLNVTCKNPACVSNPALEEEVPVEFHRRAGTTTYDCMHCGAAHTFKEVWGK